MPPTPQPTAPFRLVLFADPHSWSSVTLLGAALRAAARRPDVEVVGVVDSARRPPRPGRLSKGLATRAVRRAFNPRRPAHAVDGEPALSGCGALARRFGTPLLAPRALGVNDPGFVDRVRALRPDATLALMVPAIFGEPLLEACGYPANYHNGLLPAYRGVASTEWSVYEGAGVSGFTFHRMTAGVDEGPILMQDSVPAGPAALPVRLERAKTRLAARRMPAALERLVGRDSGVAQVGTAHRHTRAQTAALVAVGDPSAFTWAELELRLRAFEQIELEIAGERWPVTGLKACGERSRGRALAFRTSDGVLVRPVRAKHVPPFLYGGVRSLRAISAGASSRASSQQA